MAALFAKFTVVNGSSPRVWGKSNSTLSVFQFWRFIPTRVGKMFMPSLSTWQLLRFIPTRVGKIHWHFLFPFFFLRFIPTRVGKITLASNSENAMSVHPHACGENAGADLAVAQSGRFIPTRVGKMPTRRTAVGERNGSSPRVWGKCIVFHHGNIRPRFIPTRVGKIGSSKVACRTVIGSSPRVWGKSAPLLVII